MRSPGRASRQEFEGLDLEVHSFLAGVPLHDVTVVDLPGGGPGREISDVRSLFSRGTATSPGIPVRILFAVRAGLGRVFGWDREAHAHPEQSYLHRLTELQTARSLVPPGTVDGIFKVLYVFRREALGEVRNATVHAFSCMALEPIETGYRLYWGIYVKPVSRFTSVYMSLIEPFRRFVVYPALLRRLRAAWISAH